MIENLDFGRSGLNSSVFEKLFVSHSCIFFLIKQCALRSFYIKMLCFSKNLFFQIFNRSNLLLDRLKMRLKFWIQFSWLNRCSIGAGSIEIDFRLIQSNFRPIKNWSKSFLKQAFLTCSSLYSNFSKSFLLSLSLSSTDPLQVIFCHFLPNFSQGFLSSSAGKTFLPFLFHFIHILHAFFMHIRWNIWTYRNLGFLIFELISFKFDYWVFVLRWCKHDSHSLIWLNLWFGKNFKF